NATRCLSCAIFVILLSANDGTRSSLIYFQPGGPRSSGLPFHSHRDPHAAADAKRCETFLGIAPRHPVEQRHQDAASCCPDRVAERNRAAIDVDLARVPTHFLVDGAGLR